MADGSAVLVTAAQAARWFDLPAFSVQYHPEAAAGPHDSEYLFDRFVDLMTTGRTPDRSEELTRAGAQAPASQTAPTAGEAH